MLGYGRPRVLDDAQVRPLSVQSGGCTGGWGPVKQQLQQSRSILRPRSRSPRPTAGVDVSLRQDMWRMVDELRNQGVTIVLTTHYIEEAEAIADRIGVISGGKLLLVEDKKLLMSRMGQKQLKVELMERLDALPTELAERGFMLNEDSLSIVYHYDKDTPEVDIAGLLQSVASAGLGVKDIHTQQSSLEEIFVDLVEDAA